MQAETIYSRDNVKSGINCLRLGDGQARCLAWRLAWRVLTIAVTKDNFCIGHAPKLKSIFESMLTVPTMFQRPVPDEEAYLELALRQNVKAEMVKPLNTIDWCLLIMKLVAGSGGDPLSTLSGNCANARKESAKRLTERMTRFFEGYEAKVQEEGVVMEPPAKRSRRAKAKARGQAFCWMYTDCSVNLFQLSMHSESHCMVCIFICDTLEAQELSQRR